MNAKVNLRHEELSRYHKFPPIPKAELGDEHIKRNPIQARLNDYTKIDKMGRLSPTFKRTQLNRTLNNASLVEGKDLKQMKLKAKLSRKNSILKKIADHSLMEKALFGKGTPATFNEIMKTSVDRPKVT